MSYLGLPTLPESVHHHKVVRDKALIVTCHKSDILVKPKLHPKEPSDVPLELQACNMNLLQAPEKKA